MHLSYLSLAFYGVQVLPYDTFTDFVLAISCRIRKINFNPLSQDYNKSFITCYKFT